MGGAVTDGAVVDDATRAAWAYLAAVAARPTVALWDLVDERGPVEAALAVRRGRAPEAVADQTEARRPDVDHGRLLDRAAELGSRVLVPGDAGWPGIELSPLDLPRSAAREEGRRVPVSVALRPLALWWRGPADPSAVATRSVAVVGTRAPTAYGRAVAADLAAGVATEDVAVVSGGAFGVDAAAHRACLGVGGTTVAVLACGVDRPYPRGNAGLLDRVAESGAVVSEQPPGTGVTRFRFLDRNRLIAALSRATVVVEAATRSGALSTAAWASNIGRPVGAVPGPVTSVSSVGCHVLVRDRGAQLVTRAEEVVELAGRMGEVAAEPEDGGSCWDGLDDVTRRVLECVPPRGGVEPAQVARESGVPPSTVRAVLGRLAATGEVLRGEAGWRRAPDRGRQLRMRL